MKLAALPLIASLLTGGCGSDPQSVAQPAVTQEKTHSPFKALDIRYELYLARLSVHTTVTADGLLHSQQITNQSYGPRDTGVDRERTEIRQGKLTPRELAELNAMFVGWKSLSGDRYSGVADSGEIAVRYGDRLVSGGSATPTQIWQIYARISELAAKMPIVEKN
jgi:hypothetical protein